MDALSVESKSDYVYATLKQLIIAHELKQGQHLSERKISKQLGASRTPVREALKRLQKEHFVEITPEYGALVARITYDTIFEIYEMREVLEGLTARLCAIELNNDEKKELKKIYRELRDSLKTKRYKDSITYDLEFHGFIVEHSKNRMLMDTVQTIFEHSRRITRLIDYTEDWSKAVQVHHYKIIRAIITGQQENAEISMREHISAARMRQIDQLKR